MNKEEIIEKYGELELSPSGHGNCYIYKGKEGNAECKWALEIQREPDNVRFQAFLETTPSKQKKIGSVKVKDFGKVFDEFRLIKNPKRKEGSNGEYEYETLFRWTRPIGKLEGLANSIFGELDNDVKSFVMFLAAILFMLIVGAILKI